MSKMIQVMAVLLCLLLIGCATNYSQKSFWRGGYSDMKIQDDIFSIVFSGNAYISTERSGAFALLRCAEVTLENGYNYFTLLSGGTRAKQGAYTTPVQSHTTGYFTGNMYSGQTSYSGGQTIFFEKPESSCLIQCFKEKPEGIMVLDAKQVRDNIKMQYNLK